MKDNLSVLAKVWLTIAAIAFMGGTLVLLVVATSTLSPKEASFKTAICFAGIAELLLGVGLAVASTAVIKQREWGRRLLVIQLWLVLVSFLGFVVWWYVEVFRAAEDNKIVWFEITIGTACFLILAALMAWSLFVLHSAKRNTEQIKVE